jgi:hypothetical protein
MIVCGLLLEISSFIREMYPQIMKKTKTLNTAREKNIGSVFSNESISLSALNESHLHPDIHQLNLQSFNEPEPSSNYIDTNDNETSKHISFAFQEDPPTFNDNLNDYETNNDSVPIISGRSTNTKLPNQTKRSSLKHSKKASIKYKIDRTTRMVRRKVSHHNQVTDIREQDITGNIDLSEADSVFNPAGLNEAPIEFNEESFDMNKCFPWIKVILKILERFNFNCNHLDCQSNCFMKCFKRCRCSMEAILRLYEYSQNLDQESNLKQKGINTAIVNTLSGRKAKDMDRKVKMNPIKTK